MPNCNSAKKRNRQALEDRARNRSCKSAIRTSLRRIREMVAAGKDTEAKDLLPALYKQLDQAAAKHIIHANKASRLKGRLVHLIKTGNKPTAA
ncbi:MAG: 30S ribosomal protein S20 [Pirellulales bacterium]